MLTRLHILSREVRFFIAGLLIVAGSHTSLAEELAWLYEVALPVENQSETLRSQALQAGFETVLQRVTGLRTIERSPAIQEAYRNLNAYQLQLRYDEALAGNTPESQLNLIISFDRAALQELIRKAQLPMWTVQRPHVLFMISNVDQGVRTIQRRSLDNDLQQIIKATSLERGLSISQPIMDFVDRYILREGTVALGFFNQPGFFHERFDSEVVVVARIDPIAFNAYRVWWTLFESDVAYEHVFDKGPFEAAVAEIVHKTADHLADRYAVFGEAAALYIGVSGIDSVADYKGLLDYLNKWEFIDLVLLREAHGDHLELELRTSSTWDQFSDHLAADGALASIDDLTDGVNEIREFEWRMSN